MVDRYGERRLFFVVYWQLDACGGSRLSGGDGPGGILKELPIGLTFMGSAWSEATLIRLAYSFEQATKARRAPKYLATFT